MATDPSSVVAPIWSDNVPLDTLNAAVAANTTVASGATATASTQRFWSTPARPADSPVVEVMEVTLSATRLVNQIAFSAAIYPQTIVVEHYDDQLKSWQPLIPTSALQPEPLRETIHDSVPATIPPADAVTGHLHPQHSFSNHWQQFSVAVRPTQLRRLRLLLQRTTTGTAPRNTLGQLIDYSLAIKDMTLGYKVASTADVPRTSPTPGSFTERSTFASTSDVLGSAVNYSVRTNSAENILQNGSGSSASTLIWKSEPQPFPWAVVNFYVDGRDADGNPQILDKFYLEPLTDGANVNLYYSNDEPSSAFVAGDDPLTPNVGVITGKDGPNVLGSEAYGDINFVDINNQPFGFNPSKEWWLGVSLTFNFEWVNDNNNHAIFDCGAFNLAMTPLGLQLSTEGQDSLLIETLAFDAATPVQLVASYDGATLRVASLVSHDRQNGIKALTIPIPDVTPPTLRVGGFLGGNPGSGSFQLGAMVLKIHETPDEATIQDFFAHSTDYCVKAPLDGDDDHKTDNALLRYDPSTSTANFPSGFLGGPPDHYAEMTWSPIARDYVLRKGYLNLPPTKAKYWKFEFCNLIPQPYDVYVPIKRTVKTYTREMWACQPGLTATLYSSLNIKFPGLGSSIQLGGQRYYYDQTNITVSAAASKGYTSTQVRVVKDFHMQATLGSAFWAWNFISWHANVWCPRFSSVCVHTYQYLDVEQTTKMAFFVGLQKIEGYRLNYLTTEDTAQYVELFQDLNNIESDSNWELTADHELTSGGAKYAQIDSKPMSSNKMVRAVQFAATQSEASQVLPDDDFDDPTHANWYEVGDGHIVGTEEVATLGSVLRVDRSPHPLDWGALESLVTNVSGVANGTFAAFEAQNMTFRMVEQFGNPAMEAGGIESNLFDTPPGGRVYVAGRCVTPKDLTRPLFVQIVDENDRVLSESGTTVRAGQVAEWYTSYTIGEGGEILAYRWDDFSAPPSYTLFVDTFQHANSPVLQLMDSGQAWTPTTSGTTVISHSIASYEAVQNASGTAVDSFTADTVWGGIDFTVGTMGTGTQVPLIGFDPWTINDQGALSFLGGTVSPTPPASVFGRALVAGDRCHIDILPTKSLATNQRDATAPLDDVSTPYSLVFYLNGVLTLTYAHRYGARHRRFIQGRAGQHFRYFSWTPGNYEQPLANTIWKAPTAAMGGSYDSIGYTWTSNTGTVWSQFGYWDNTTSRLVALSNGAEFHTETGYWYGTLHARVHNVATGNASFPNLHGNVLVLDADNGVYIDAYGYVNQGGTAWYRLFPNGIPDDVNISVQFADTKSVAYSVRGAIDANATPRMLIGRTNGVVSGVWGSALLNSWGGTVRGLAGDTYNNGVDQNTGNPLPLPNGVATGDICTSFDMFDWAPDTATLSLAPGTPTWDDVTRRGTATFADAAQGQLLEPNRFRARLVQKGLSNDIWEVDTLSMYVDPIVWYFSNDGGQNFFPAYDIRNDPHGVLTFPTQDVTQPYNPNFGQQLVWRAVSYAGDSSISSLVIRPWYAGLVSGVTHRVGVFSGDPNVMPYDHYPDLAQDARFQVWHSPIPQNWWYSYRILERSKDAPVPQPQLYALPESLINDVEPS